MHLRVVTWNIHKGIGGLDRRYHLRRVIDVLQDNKPDIALLQEVSADLPRSRFEDQIELLSEAMNMRHMVYNPQHHFTLGRYGNAILSRWPMSQIHQVDLTVGRRKRRGALQARARVRIGRGIRTVIVLSLHLGLSREERFLQLSQFLNSHPFEGVHERAPVILGGDFNDVWNTLGPRLLEPGGFRRCSAGVNTFPAWLPMRPLDAIYVRGDLSTVACRTCRSRNCRLASDHLPLIADVELMGITSASFGEQLGAAG